MILSEIKQQFEIRYYLWATSEFEREIDELLPSLRLFQFGPVRELHHFMQKLDRDEQLNLAHSLLKRFHPEAVMALGENCSTEEESLRYRLDEFRRNPSGDINAGFAAKRCATEIKFASKRQLLKLMAQQFQNKFEGRCIESERTIQGDPRLEFQMNCCGWSVFTYFWFGQRESLIEYGHTISSEIVLDQHGPQGTYRAPFVISSMISFCSWLGISSQTQWQYLTIEDAGLACDTVTKLCGHFFEVAPKLLKGLEFDKIEGAKTAV